MNEYFYVHIDFASLLVEFGRKMQSPLDERGYDSMQLRPCQTLHGDEAMQSISYPPFEGSIAKRGVYVIRIYCWKVEVFVVSLTRNLKLSPSAQKSPSKPYIDQNLMKGDTEKYKQSNSWYNAHQSSSQEPFPCLSSYHLS